MSSYFAHSMSSNERDLELASTDSSGWPSLVGTPYTHPLCTVIGTDAGCHKEYK